MKNLLHEELWDWKTSGIALGIVFLIAIVFVKPIGVSTQFVIFDGIVWSVFDNDLITKDATAAKGYSSTNEYLNKGGGKYAKSIAKPINYSFIFVISMVVGGLLAFKLQKVKPHKEELTCPTVWSNKFGKSSAKRYFVVFLGGALALFGARLAGGCTSGHMMSGMMQTSLSGYLFAFGAFALAIPVAILIYKK